VTVSNPAGESVVTFTGSVVSGEFAGDAAVMVVTSATLNALACIAPPGVTSTSGTNRTGHHRTSDSAGRTCTIITSAIIDRH
jgi:hypothetical protein